MTPEQFKESIRQGLKHRGVSQKEAAEKTGMTPPQLSRFLNEPEKGIHIDKLCRLLTLAGLELMIKPS